jgi:hypothetical protein
MMVFTTSEMYIWIAHKQPCGSNIVVFLKTTLRVLARNPIGTSNSFSCFTPELDSSSDLSPSADKGLRSEVRIYHAVSDAIKDPQ